MNKERLPRTILKWCLPGRRRQGRPRNSWMEKITGMREKGINSMEWMYNEEWRRKNKIKTLDTDRYCI